MRGPKIGLASAEVVLEAALVLGQRRHEGRGGCIQHVRLIGHLPWADLCTRHQAEMQQQMCCEDIRVQEAPLLVRKLHRQSLKKDVKDMQHHTTG